MMGKRFKDIIKLNRTLSWLLTAITVVMLTTGYSMTFIGVDIPILRIIHYIVDAIFTFTFTTHTIINTFIFRFKWKPIISSLLLGKANITTKLRLLQRISSLGLLITGVLQVVSGLDWFKLGLSRLLPYLLHRKIDLVLFVFLIIHLSLAVYFNLLKQRVQKKEERKNINRERREAITVMGGAILAFVAALFLDKAPKVGTDITGTQGTLPPGQSEIEKLKVLHLEIGNPSWDPESWRFEVNGSVDNPFSLSWEEFRALPNVTRVADFHCVTGWTKLTNKWEGISFQLIKELAKLRPNARYATIESLSGYKTSLPISELSREDVLFAYRLDDKELPREHGGPLRLVVPHKYAYKSAKWVIKVKFTDFLELGYWEMRGYSNTANPYTNDRYSELLNSN
jgi:DMSO/TMAO reductase YedYZ molybdopterin-dependent catalytic subunit